MIDFICGVYFLCSFCFCWFVNLLNFRCLYLFNCVEAQQHVLESGYFSSDKNILFLFSNGFTACNNLCVDFGPNKINL